jgi:hypothetical protein
MATIRCCAIGIGLVLGAAGAGPVELREEDRPGVTTRVQVELKAEGLYLPAAAPGASKEEAPKPLALKVEAQLDYFERRLKAGAPGGPGRAVRRVVRAASAINGEVRPAAATIRPEVALLVAEPRAEGVVVFSPGGPLTRSELELVQGPGDPLELGGLLPDRPVAVGDRWAVIGAAARAISAYDTVAANKLEATLESVDAGSARVRLRGEVRGSVLGGEGTMACDGTFSFDRKAGRVDRLTVQRAETRRPGVVEEGLDVKGTLSVTRRSAETPTELGDEALAGRSLEPGAGRERLILFAPGGRYSLEHGRDWHTYWDDSRVTVLKRVEGGRLVAQCNLATGPSAGRGRHQDPDQFRDDVRKGLGARFGQILGAGEVDGDPAGGFRYKVGVKGRQGDLGVVWYYYLIASPEGDQLLATFTLAESQARAFGDQDEALIGSLRWRDRPAEKADGGSTPAVR